MLSAPTRVILEPIQAALLVLPHPAADGLLVYHQNLSDLPIAIATMDQDQGMIALAFMASNFHVLISSDCFLVIFLTQHGCLPASSPIISPLAYRFLRKSTSCCSV